jgi:phosphopantothenoylcysteine decarboxylase/phosphopantothenate--cysteine ligase
MRFLVTCGPTYECLDKVRRLTNFSTGALGIGLANHLASAGHQVTLLKGYYATCPTPSIVPATTFTTTEDLLQQIRGAAQLPYHAIFHSAAVSDFRFGTIFRRGPDGRLESLQSGKFSTRDGNLLAELIPTPKIISQLRDLFPSAKIVGWKYEVEGSRERAIELAMEQIRSNRTDFSVANGPAYGPGFGIISLDRPLKHCADHDALYNSLLKLALD